MKFQLGSIGETAISNALKTAIYGTASVDCPFLNRLGLSFYNAYRDEDLVWDFETQFRVEPTVHFYILRNFNKYSGIAPYLDKETGLVKLSDNGRTITRDASGEANGAVENQPINANINEITSPSGKTSNISSSTETATENKLSDDIERMDVAMDKNFYLMMWNDLLKMLDYYCKIY